MAIPVHAQWQEDDPERTDVIPRIEEGYAETPPWQPDAPSRPDGRYVDAYPGALPPDRDDIDADAMLKRGKRRRSRKKPLWQEVLTLLGIALVLTFLIQHFFGRVYSIPSGSMEKTLHGCTGCSNDRILVDKLSYAFVDPDPGDVVVFEGPDSWDEEYGQDLSSNLVTGALQSIGALVGLAPPDESDFVKRVIAVGGQTVECCDPKGRVIVEGRPLDEPYVYWKDGKPNGKQRFDPVVVPEGTIWVMGDNRNNSRDSRFQGGGGIRGVVPIDKVIGKARYIVLPLSRWQGVGDHDPQDGIPVAMGAPAWQQGLPAGVGFVAAWPMLWLSRRIRLVIRPPGRTTSGKEPAADP